MESRITLLLTGRSEIWQWWHIYTAWHWQLATRSTRQSALGNRQCAILAMAMAVNGINGNGIWDMGWGFGVEVELFL
jgi:hypothetical protein